MRWPWSKPKPLTDEEQIVADLTRRTQAGELQWESVEFFQSDRRQGIEGNTGSLGPIGLMAIAYVASAGEQTWQILCDSCMGDLYSLHLDGEQIVRSLPDDFMRMMRAQKSRKEEEARRPTIERARRVAAGGGQ
jgi:hypothetical protein